MAGILDFQRRYGDEAACLAKLVEMRWPDGFQCPHCGASGFYQLHDRGRVLQCRKCRRQTSITAGTVFHRTRTPLPVWFFAAYMMARDHRGIPAMMLAKEFDLRYETAWLICHKLRHALTENQGHPLEGLVEADETYYGGRGSGAAGGRSTNDGKTAVIVLAVEKKSTWTKPKRKTGVKGQGFTAGGVRVSVVPSAAQEDLHPFIIGAVAKDSSLITDGWGGYAGVGSANPGHPVKHHPLVQGKGENAIKHMPISHILFSDIKTWLNGTFHGVSRKHLPRYIREWTYRFNRRGGHDLMPDFVLGRAVRKTTITYDQLVGGAKVAGSL